MATTITFEHEGKEYTLCYTRNTVKKLFGLGFTIDLMNTNPIEAVELLGYGAFLENHKNIKRADAVAIICELEDAGEENALAAALMDMVSEALDETVLKKKGNVKWQVNK